MPNDFINKDKYTFIDKSSIEIYEKDLIKKRKNEIKLFRKELRAFNIKIKNLAMTEISIEKRNLLLNLVFIVNSNKSLLKEFLKTQKLPLEKISAITYEPILNISPYKDYLKAYIILIKNDDYKLILKHLNIFENDDFGGKINLHKNKKNSLSSKKQRIVTKNKKDNRSLESKYGNSLDNKNIYSGLIVSKHSGGRVILTTSGEFKWVKRQKKHSNRIGEIIVSKKAKSLKNIRIILGIILILSLAFLSFSYFSQNKIETTILFKGNGEVKASFNTSNELVNIYAKNNKGTIILEDAEFAEKNIDYILGEILEQAYIKGIVKERDDITIIISGVPAKEEVLLSGRLNDRVISYKVKCKINNDGSLIYLK